jgi:carboxyl-terminal processing protease
MKKNWQKFILILIFLIILLGIFVLGIYLGYQKRSGFDKISFLANKDIPNEITADFEPFWKVWNVLNKKSIHVKEISEQDKVWGATKGLVSSLGDPYTVFLSPEENKSFNEEITGSFEGIGAEIGIKDNILTIIAPLKNSPAWKSGLKAGDKILEIDGVLTTEMTINKAIGLIRGQKGTAVVLTIFRIGENKTRELKVVRDRIEVPALETEFITGDDIFVIKFYTFSEKSTSLFRDALIEFFNTKTNKLIIDLRDNPGGYLDVAINIASWFIDEGKVIVNEDFKDKAKTKVYRSRGPRLFNETLSLVVLINEGSASASEILAGALREHGIATLVGEKTYGKGSVQELVEITKETSLKVTIADWLTPDGLSISLEGLKPDIEVEYTAKDLENKIDPQMNKAIEILKLKN